MTKHHKSPDKPTKLLWLTDLHLDRVNGPNHRRLTSELSRADFDAAVITGDIASAQSVCDHLEVLAAACHPRPLYFVLGNHDFYGAEMSRTYDHVARLCNSTTNLHHLQDTGPVSLGRHTVLCGHHGWADARCGWGRKTIIKNPDHWSIPDFRGLTSDERFDKMEQLGRESASAIRRGLLSALRAKKHVVIATHVPAFRTSALFDDKPCGPCHQPHFVNSSLGAMLIGVAGNTQKHFTVLSGHTHNRMKDTILTNLHSHVGGSRKGDPAIQEILEI